MQRGIRPDLSRNRAHFPHRATDAIAGPARPLTQYVALGDDALCNDGSVEDLVGRATALVAEHPAVDLVEFAGSRSRGTHDELSDWDFAVTTSDFAAVAADMPALVAPLEPLGEQWEPMGHFPVYQVLLRGPTKVEYVFLDHSQQAARRLSRRAQRRYSPLTITSVTGCGGSRRRPASVAMTLWPSTSASSMNTGIRRIFEAERSADGTGFTD